MSKTSVNDILQIYNFKYHMKVLSAIVFLATVLVIGFIGNSLVFYIYLTKIKTTTIRCFIMALAIMDLCICVFDIPLEIVDLRLRYTFGSNSGLCKTFHIFHDFIFISSMYILVAIAVERFKKVCQPFKKQMTIFAARVIIIVCCVVGFLLAIPAGFKYGQKTLPTNFSFANGTGCSTADDHDPDLVLVNYIFWIVQDVATFAVLTILYCRIWYKVTRHLKKRRAMASGERSNEISLHSLESRQVQIDHINTQETSGTVSIINFNQHVDNKNHDRSGNQANFRSSYRQYPESTDVSGTNRKSSALSTGGMESRGACVRNMTTVMFMVALVSFFAYVPIFCKMIIRIISEEKLKTIDAEASWLYYIVWRTYYIPCASNPLIYGFCNTAFRCQLTQLLKGMKRKLYTGQ